MSIGFNIYCIRWSIEYFNVVCGKVIDYEVFVKV